MSNKLLFRLAVLVAAMMCALGAAAAEAYVFYTSSDSTLTFYYDDLLYSRTGGIPGYLNEAEYDPYSGENIPDWLYDNFQLGVARVVFDSSFADARPTTMFSWFANMDNLRVIEGWENLNTSQVTSMNGVFYNCNKLTSINLSHFNTDAVTFMPNMFCGCTELSSIDLSKFNTAQVTNMEYMFSGCSKLTNVKLDSFNTQKVIYMGNMFENCGELTVLDLSSFNTARVTDMTGMFAGSSNLRTIYVGSGWSTAAVTTSSDMFYGCTSLVGGMGTTYDTNHVGKFYAQIDGGTDNPGYFTDKNAPVAYACYTPSNTTLTFYYDNQRYSRPGQTYFLNGEFELPGWIMDWLDLENNLHPATQVVFDPSFADARPISTAYWFLGMRNLQSFSGLSYLNTSEVTNMTSMFSNCSGLTSLDLSSFNTANVAYMESMFLRCSGLTSIDLSSFNTANVGDMSDMFEDCTALTSLDLSSFNTARASFIPYMFNRCSNLTTIYAGSGWNLPADAYSEGMFQDCTSLVGSMGTSYDPNHKDAEYARIDGGPDNPGYFTDINAPAEPEPYAVYTPDNTTLTFYYDDQRTFRPGTVYGLNTGSNYPAWYNAGIYSSVLQVVFDASFADARPTSAFYWFSEMNKLQTIEGLANLNTSEVTNMASMFSNCRKLTSLDLSTFNTDKVTTTDCMFLYCTGLTSVDLRGFTNAKLTRTANMFQNCSALTTIYADSNWSLPADNYSWAMFMDCTSLVGGKGTAYDENHTDDSYAHIDGGPSNPGYFTEIPEAYACYTESNTTLTFYCDNQRSSRTGTTYDVNLNQGLSFPAWITDDVVSNVTKAVFDPSFANARPTSTGAWFGYMSKLKSITGLNFLNTSEVTYMELMLYGCSGLTNLDLSSWNTAMVTNMQNMFVNCSGLTTIYVGDEWSTDAVTQSANMFYGCTSLVGGQGTTYNANHIDKTYAHIDGGPSNPGYFTAKNAGLRGDVNGDGNVTISDVTALIDLLLGGGTINNPAADCNNDTNVTISDVTALIDYLLGGSWN